MSNANGTYTNGGTGFNQAAAGGFGNDADYDRSAELNRLRSATSVSMSPELFEKLYLSPPNQVKGQLRKTFANPTPIALVGFVLSLTPLSCALMGWRGAGNNGAATIGVYFFMGGLLMFVGGLLEWVLGNTFAAVVFTTFGGFWFSYGATLNPQFAAYALYSIPGDTTELLGLQTRGFNATFAFWLLSMGLVCTIFFICAFRTNIIFVTIFFSLMMSFFLLAGASWAMAEDFTGNAKIAHRCTVGGGAAGFVTSMCGWYLLTSILLAVVDFPIQLPVGDLTRYVKGRSERLAKA